MSFHLSRVVYYAMVICDGYDLYTCFCDRTVSFYCQFKGKSQLI